MRLRFPGPRFCFLPLAGFAPSDLGANLCGGRLVLLGGFVASAARAAGERLRAGVHHQGQDRGLLQGARPDLRVQGLALPHCDQAAVLRRPPDPP